MNRSRPLAVLLAGALVLGLVGCVHPRALPTPNPPAPPTGATVGEALTGDAWSVTVLSAELDATAAVAAANEFNPKPEEGAGYATVNLNLTRTAADGGIPLDVDVALIVGDETLTPAPVVASAQLYLLDELASGSQTTGNLVFVVPAGSDTAQVRVTPGAGAPTYLVDVP